jgi:Cholesterol oxidase, substrate-binding
MVKAQSGATIDALMNFLEEQSGGKGAAPGYSFPHIPATGNLTIGGVLAINGHGTAIPVHGEDISTSYGSLSNRIIAFTAVVTDPDGARPDRYAIREFSRGEGDDRAFLVHLGRAFLLDATLEVIDNYNMRCQSFVDISPNVLFQAPNPESSTGHESLMTFLQTTGRAEVLWYPLSDKAWLKVWTVTRSKPHTSTAVKLPYNYPFSHNLSKFGGLFLYAKETTTRLTMSGYAVQIRRMEILTDRCRRLSRETVGLVSTIPRRILPASFLRFGISTGRNGASC